MIELSRLVLYFSVSYPASDDVYTLSLHDALPIYLNAKGALTYTDIAGDPVLYGNLPPREISMKDVFRSGDSSKKFKIAEGQWYRYAPSYVDWKSGSAGKECGSAGMARSEERFSRN